MNKPLLLMDVDGVIFPFSVGHFVAFDGGEPWISDPDWKPGQEGFLFHPEHHVFWSPKNAERIRSLMEHFDVCWCTGWGHRANQVVSPMHDLPPFPVVDIGYGFSNGGMPHWKGGGITKYVGDGIFAFVDDDITDDTLEWAANRNLAIPTLLRRTEPHIGLTDDICEGLLQFVEIYFPF